MLALRRSGVSSIELFQKQQAIPVTGRLDEATKERLLPYLLGYETVTLRPGDSFWTLSREYGSTLEAISAANPTLDPRNLQVGTKVTVPLGFPLVPTDVPMTSRLSRLILRGLEARYPFLERRVLTVTAFGRPMEMVQIGTGPRKAIYSASHHANEWITTTVLLAFLEDYAKAVAQGRRIGGYDARELAKTTTLYMVPMVDPDGVDLVTGAISPKNPQYEYARRLGARYPEIPFPSGWKANLLGVDLNLNYPALWEEAKKIKYAQGYNRPGPRDFVGDAPLDQRESKALWELTRKLNPELVLAYHSQGRVIYWKFQDLFVPGARELGETFSARSGYALEDTPYSSSFAGYKDWFIQDFRRPGYTIEVGEGENPLPLSQFPRIYSNNLGILTTGLAQ